MVIIIYAIMLHHTLTSIWSNDGVSIDSHAVTWRFVIDDIMIRILLSSIGCYVIYVISHFYLPHKH